MTESFRLRIGIIWVMGIISVVIGGHFGGGDHFDGGDHFGGGTRRALQDVKAWNFFVLFKFNGKFDTVVTI